MGSIAYKGRMTNPAQRSVAFWLYGCSALIFLMVIVGAITRLTESGLSMVEWKPLIGAVPPLGESEWTRVFNLYKQSPEFQQKNFWMGIEDFKRIFFWEWFHRLLGRLIGVVFALPLVWFWIRGKLPQGSKLKLLGLFLLGGAQGAMGWFMVKSGLVDNPAVSHYRLTAHLGLAFILYALILGMALLLDPKTRNKIEAPPCIGFHFWIMTAFIVITIIWGAFTAGLDGGLIYNDSFPLMGGRWIPDEITHGLSLLETPAGVQFVHRWLAIATMLVILSFWFHMRRRKINFAATEVLGAMAIVQAGLGISTLLSGVFIGLAVMHQAGALIIITLLVLCWHRLHIKGTC